MKFPWAATAKFIAGLFTVLGVIVVIVNYFQRNQPELVARIQILNPTDFQWLKHSENLRMLEKSDTANAMAKALPILDAAIPKEPKNTEEPPAYIESVGPKLVFDEYIKCFNSTRLEPSQSRWFFDMRLINDGKDAARQVRVKITDLEGAVTVAADGAMSQIPTANGALEIGTIQGGEEIHITGVSKGYPPDNRANSYSDLNDKFRVSLDTTRANLVFRKVYDDEGLLGLAVSTNYKRRRNPFSLSIGSAPGFRLSLWNDG